MFCPSCGEEIPDDSAACNNCGEQLQQQAANPNPGGGQQGTGGGAGHQTAAPRGHATASPGLGALFTPGNVVKVVAGIAAVVGVMQFVTYVDWMADALAWQGHIMYWALTLVGALLVAVGFMGDEGEDEEGFSFQARLLAVIAALLVFSMITAATGSAMDMSFGGVF